MAETEKGSEISETLKPFFLRASDAEERLSRLEAALAGVVIGSKEESVTIDSGNEEHLKIISELRSKLEAANSELISEQKKTQTLASENAKLKYRIKHLVRAVEEADRNAIPVIR